MLNSLKINKVLICCITMLLLQGCQKDSPVSGNCSTCADEECLDFVWPGSINFEEYITTGSQYKLPFFNPLNDAEFVYVKVVYDTSPFTYELIKHVISSGEETILCNTLTIISQPQWSKLGWIVFSTLNQTIWKVRDNGTQLTQITGNGLSFHTPILNASGERFIQMGTSSPPYIGIYDLNGMLVDSIKFQIDNYSLGYFCTFNEDFKDGYYRYADDSQPYIFGFCKLVNNQSLEILNSFSFLDGAPSGSCKNDKNLFYTQFQNGLYSLNLTTGSVDKIITNCQSKYIMTLSMSPDGNFILYEQVKGVQTGVDQIIDEQSDIYMINVHTRKKTKIIGE